MVLLVHPERLVLQEPLDQPVSLVLQVLLVPQALMVPPVQQDH